ncbi:MAG: RDD family protein [Bacteriovoracia bacterium]
MPIPYYIPEASAPETGLRLLAPPAPAPERASLHITARLMAHALDLAVVLGASAYAAKFFAVVFVAIYRTEFQTASSAAVFFEAFDYANGQLVGACAGFFSILYFVALPAWLGRTFGMGLFGLKIVDREGRVPSVEALARRLLGFTLVYVSGGSLLLSSLRSRKSALPQDNFSATFVRKA